MTHGSVVARECGIPAIVGVEKVTEKLSTGQLVRADGSTGVVEILEEEKNTLLDAAPCSVQCGG